MYLYSNYKTKYDYDIAMINNINLNKIFPYLKEDDKVKSFIMRYNGDIIYGNNSTLDFLFSEKDSKLNINSSIYSPFIFDCIIKDIKDCSSI